MNKNNIAIHLERHPIFPGKYCFPLSPNLRQNATEPSFQNDQIWFIIDMIGTPAEEDIAFLTDENAIKYIKSFQPKQPKDFATIFPDTPPEGLDLLKKMLVFNP